MKITSLNRTPSLMALYVASLFKRPNRRAKLTDAVDLAVCLNQVKIAPIKIDAFEDFFQLNKTQNLPVVYPFLQAFRLHFKLLLSPQLPFRLLGLVHLSNNIHALKPIPKNQPLNFKVMVNNLELSQRGMEVELLTQVSIGDELVWQCSSVYLSKKHKANKQPSKTPNTFEHFSQRTPMVFTRDAGRRYAKLTGDANPIHMFKLTAKLLGFKRAIAHGVYAATRAFAQLQPQEHYPLKYHCQFNRPVFLPSHSHLYFERQNKQLNFYLYPDRKARHEHLKQQEGWIEYL